MRNIKLADGSVFPVDRCGASDGTLYLRVTAEDYTVQQAAVSFGDPAKTVIIEHYFDGTNVDHQRFIGFTVLQSLILDRNGVTIYLGEAEEGGGRIEPVE